MLIKVCLGLCNSFSVVGFSKTKEGLLELALKHQVGTRKPYIGEVLLAKEVRATLDPPLRVYRTTSSQYLDLFRDLKYCQLDTINPIVITYIWILLLHYFDNLLIPAGS